jgi:sugar phosphate isomerase/epimerase
MLLGMMNDPHLDASAEARWAAEHGFEFLDLTLEGPAASVDQIDLPTLRSLLHQAGLRVVGHTAWYLPFASPVARVRQAAVESVADTFEAFAALGAQWVNVHIGLGPKLFKREDYLRWNGESFARLAERAARYGLRIMAEHPPDPHVGVADCRAILAADERLGFHLDVGHANVGGGRLDDWLQAFGPRLAHVHLSDNRGHHDDHMPLGSGQIDWPRAIRLLKGTGYDGTITLEVFGPDRDYLLGSAQKVRTWWRDG